jgi:hypothetical protein
MQIKVHAMAAMLALSVGLGGCGDTGLIPQQGTENAPTDGGYGPFGGDTGANAPLQPAAQGGAESVVSGGSAAPTEFQSLITGYLDRYAQEMANGWSQVQTVPDVITALQLNNEHRWQVSLRGGQTYGFIGACDNECSNVDLILEDASGAQIKTDVLTDDYPLVDFTPQADGVYTLRIQLKACTIAPCYVGARLVRR